MSENRLRNFKNKGKDTGVSLLIILLTNRIFLAVVKVTKREANRAQSNME